ncbi:MAG: radical SAM protein [Candidatus Omnitrophica bacterium]|nr:radical SAM protein [Candidatus Omnitrophota bacterium]
MPVMEITTGVGCKISCAYCPQETFVKAYVKRSNVMRMSLDAFKSYADKIPVYVDIIFSGMNEPWLNPDCTAMLLYAHERGRKITVNTTLVGMSVSDVDILSGIPFERFIVHLPCVENYEKIEVNGDYLDVLERIEKSGIKIRYYFYGSAVHPQVGALIKDDIFRMTPYTRSGNIKIKGRYFRKRRKGVIACQRRLRWNILLPNGDVILCSNDYGMLHVLGNLNTDSYDSLFLSNEFLNVKKGLRDERIDIICRYCDMYAKNEDIVAKLWNPIYFKHKDVL